MGVKMLKIPTENLEKLDKEINKYRGQINELKDTAQRYLADYKELSQGRFVRGMSRNPLASFLFSTGQAYIDFEQTPEDASLKEKYDQLRKLDPAVQDVLVAESDGLDTHAHARLHR